MEASQDQRARAALARIDRALARVEAIAAAPPQPSAEAAELERLSQEREQKIVDFIYENDVARPAGAAALAK